MAIKPVYPSRAGAYPATTPGVRSVRPIRTPAPSLPSQPALHRLPSVGRKVSPGRNRRFASGLGRPLNESFGYERDGSVDLRPVTSRSRLPINSTSVIVTSGPRSGGGSYADGFAYLQENAGEAALLLAMTESTYETATQGAIDLAASIVPTLTWGGDRIPDWRLPMSPVMGIGGLQEMSRIGSDPAMYAFWSTVLEKFVNGIAWIQDFIPAGTIPFGRVDRASCPAVIAKRTSSPRELALWVEEARAAVESSRAELIERMFE